jgi:hypothetical protein
MGLRSNLFRGDPKLEAAAISDPAHIMMGAAGQHVGKIQQALIQLDRVVIDRGELQSSRYGPSTANAVLSYKKKRNIINRTYQSQADNIVGKMTMAALDQDMVRLESASPDPQPICQCGNHFARHSNGGAATFPQLIASTRVATLSLAGQLQGSSPRAAALARVDQARDWITKTIDALRRANVPHRGTTQKIPEKEWQGLNANFGLPHGFTRSTRLPDAPVIPLFTGEIHPKEINTKEEYINQLILIYNKIRKHINASVIKETFLTKKGVVGETTYGITLTKTDNPLDKDLPDGCYFTPFYTTAGVDKQIEVLVHEAAHFVNNDLIKDNFHPDGANYFSMTPGMALTNAYSYSTFAIHTMFGFTGILEHDGSFP